MQTFRIEVGRNHAVTPSNIVGAIANEAGLEAKHIGRIEIHDDHSTLDLPSGMPKELLHHLKGVWVAGQQLKISTAGPEAEHSDKAAVGKAGAAGAHRPERTERGDRSDRGERTEKSFSKPGVKSERSDRKPDPRRDPGKAKAKPHRKGGKFE